MAARKLAQMAVRVRPKREIIREPGEHKIPVKELTTKREAKSALDSRIPSQMGVLKLWSRPSWKYGPGMKRQINVSRTYL